MRYTFVLLFTLLLAYSLRAQNLIKDIRPGQLSSSSAQLISFQNTLFFVADDAIHGSELWKSDGTPAGTTLVKDINPGPAGSDITELTIVNGKLFFSAIFNKQKKQLWCSDGTPAGTIKLNDKHNDQEVFTPQQLTKVGNLLYYVKQGSLGGQDQWLLQKSDGTDAGTTAFEVYFFDPVKDGKNPPSNLISANGLLYFTYQDELWKTDGSKPVKVKPGLKARSLVSYKDGVYFVSGPDEADLWTTMGTPASTQPIITTITGLVKAPIKSLKVAGQFLYMTAGVGEKDLWVSSGTAKTTKKLASFTWPARNITNLFIFTKVPAKTEVTYFTANTNSDLFLTNGQTVTKVTGAFSGKVQYLVRSKGALYFTSGTNLFKTTGLQADLVNTSAYYSFNLTDVHNKLYCIHDSVSTGFEPAIFGQVSKSVSSLKGLAKAGPGQK